MAVVWNKGPVPERKAETEAGAGLGVRYGKPLGSRKRKKTRRVGPRILLHQRVPGIGARCEDADPYIAQCYAINDTAVKQRSLALALDASADTYAVWPQSARPNSTRPLFVDYKLCGDCNMGLLAQLNIPTQQLIDWINYATDAIPRAGRVAPPREKRLDAYITMSANCTITYAAAPFNPWAATEPLVQPKPRSPPECYWSVAKAAGYKRLRIMVCNFDESSDDLVFEIGMGRKSNYVLYMAE